MHASRASLSIESASRRAFFTECTRFRIRDVVEESRRVPVATGGPNVNGDGKTRPFWAAHSHSHRLMSCSCNHKQEALPREFVIARCQWSRPHLGICRGTLPRTAKRDSSRLEISSRNQSLGVARTCALDILLGFRGTRPAGPDADEAFWVIPVLNPQINGLRMFFCRTDLQPLLSFKLAVDVKAKGIWVDGYIYRC